MRKWIRKIYYESSLPTKIRYSYLLLIFPFILILLLSIFFSWKMNQRYGEMIHAAAVASEFSQDFKNDFDYEAYLLIVGNREVKDSRLHAMVDEAERVVENLKEITDEKDNSDRLKSIEKYLRNMDGYVNRIEANLVLGNRYEENMEIWENDIQIVSSLVSESISQYIYYEVSGLQEAYDGYQKLLYQIIGTVLILVACMTLVVIILSYIIPETISKPIMDQVEEEQHQLRQAELEILQEQINPHFLYNTLDGIVWLAESGEQQKVVQMVSSLSGFFRLSLSQGKDMVPLGEEIRHVKSYLEIQQMRYQDILVYEVQDMDDLFAYRIPKISLQPLVENALYHGIKNKRGGGKITVSGEQREDSILLTVTDNGIGMTEERLSQVRRELEEGGEEKTIYGLYNVNERIHLHFGEEYGLTIESVYGEGTKATIRLPME